MVTFTQDNLMYTVSQFTGPYSTKRAAVRILKNHDGIFSLPFLFFQCKLARTKQSWNFERLKLCAKNVNYRQIRKWYSYLLYIINFHVFSIAHALPNGHSSQRKKTKAVRNDRNYDKTIKNDTNGNYGYLPASANEANLFIFCGNCLFRSSRYIFFIILEV